MEEKKEMLTPDEILQFHKVIHISEKDLKENQGGFKMGEGRVKKIKADNQLILKKVKNSSGVVKHEEMNSFLFTRNRDSQGASFIAHIRNAYSHSNISVDGDYFLIEDYKDIYKKGKKVGEELTAYGRIHRNLLFPLIDCMMEDRAENLKLRNDYEVHN